VCRESGLEPLECKPAEWFKEEYLAACVGRRWVAKECKPHHLDGAIFVGQGSAALRVPRTAFSSPFVVGKHGTAEECQIKYAEHLLRKPDLLEK
jgi:hypothetical protein